jgi:hypothetical protein
MKPGFSNQISHRSKTCRAAVLMDLVVATGVAAVVLLAMCLLSMYTGRAFAALGNYADLDRASRIALDQMTREIRGAQYLVSATSNSLVFNLSGTNASTTNVTYTFSPSARTLTRSCTGQPDKQLLTNCDYVTFNTYQRNMSNQVFGAFSNATAATCKLVDLNWRCSRQIFKQAVNTESVQTAKIVLRNEQPH